MVNLKKCPFCGKPKVKLLQGASEPTLVAVCANCGAQAPKYMRATQSITEADKQQAFALWQHRVLERARTARSGKSNAETQERICKGCGAKFLVGKGGRHLNSQYCSIECMQKTNYGKKRA